MLVIAKDAKGNPYGILPQYANRHGLVTGVTGSGKTMTLKFMAEKFSEIGVPCFAADVKGDLLQSGRFSVWCPVKEWNLEGVPPNAVQATVDSMGPILFSRLLGLNETQTDVLTTVFRITQDYNMGMYDLNDLKAMLGFISRQHAALRDKYGNIAPVTVATISRGVNTLETNGGDKFFSRTGFSLAALLDCKERLGVLNILKASNVIQSPQVYSTMLLWLLSALFEKMPEVGDADKPKLVFFFDEAHLLFSEMPKSVEEKIKQIIRLIRSKGVGIYFLTQYISDIPKTILGQLNNRVQHAIRAYSPADQVALRAAAECFNSNPQINAYAEIPKLKVGEALVSFLDEDGVPLPVQRAMIGKS